METNNDASQTLFRMVSLRNAKLTETKTNNFGFVQRPEGVAGFFDEALSKDSTKVTKFQVMNKAAATFNNVLKTEKDVESSPYGKLLIIGRKISRNEGISADDWKYTKLYYSNLIDSQSKTLNAGGVNELTILWDHLIYQVITQKDFYVKEAISQVLKAVHLGFVQYFDINEEIIAINGEKPLEKALDAKIVLPVALFKDDSSNTSIIDSNTDFTATLSPVTTQRLINEAQQQIVLNEALFKKEALVKLNTELKQLEKSYFKLRNQEYDKAYAAYKAVNQPIIDAYEQQLKELQVQTANKDQAEANVTPSSIQMPEIPPFEFVYKNEINIGDLQSKLTEESLALFLSLFATQVETVLSGGTKGSALVLQSNQFQLGDKVLQFNDELENYNYAINVIEEQAEEQTKIALQVAPLVQEQYVNLGGATIPVAQSSVGTHLAYSLTASPTVNLNIGIFSPVIIPGFVLFSFDVENTTWNVVSAKITAVVENGNRIEETYTNIAVVNNKVTLPACLRNKFVNLLSFRVDIVFGNSREAYLELSKVPNKIPQVGMLTLKSLASDSSTKRKNFGIKRLGVADYLKVVQSVHAYVPGLVSNIENVMASELRHKSSVAREYSEITDTTSKSQETEKVSDTSKTSRTDMQTEVAREIDKQQAITAHTRFNYDTKVYKFEIGAEYANNTAQHDSTRQAVMKSQELTEKAMERVLTKVSEERVQKIIKEYTETNVHEFDNRGKVVATNSAEAAQPKHITGVYRWIDTKYKNQIYNYGIRTMFEFMIPEPARLHRLALAVSKGQILTAPIDPRKADVPWKMPDAKTTSKELLQHWADIYKVELTELPKENFTTQKKFVESSYSVGVSPMFSETINFDDRYVATNINVHHIMHRCNGFAYGGLVLYKMSNFSGSMFQDSFVGSRNEGDYGFGNLSVTNGYVFNFQAINLDGADFTLTINCKLSDDFMLKWKTENFNAIIKAYDAAYAKFQEDQAKLDEEQKAKEEEQKAKMGQFYRYMEHDVLRHNCIAYLLQDYLTPNKTVGQSYTVGEKMEEFAVKLGDDLDKYAALAKFMEQAFEWEIMDYTFYPYYWANRAKWQEMYVSESMDPLFRSFLQSGMARVIVTVRPGFEAAVQFFLETGLIWNGGEVPVIGDPLYLSIADEMRKPLGTPQGKYWITKLPTILQDKSTGLAVPEGQALPVFPEANPANCENPSELETKSSFDLRNDQLSRSNETTTLPSTIIKPI